MAPQLILVIVADQLRPDHTGFGGSTWMATPHLDRLAASGTVFSRTYATNPICMPSRATLATGRWPSAHGTRTNGIPLDPTARTVMHQLRDAGWATAAVGKLHYQNMGWPFMASQLADIAASNPDSTSGELDDARSTWRSGHADDLESFALHRAGVVEFPDGYYGFDSVELAVGHGDHCTGHYEHWLRDHGIDPEAVAGPERSENASATWSQVWESGLPAELSTTAYVAERTIAQIAQASERDAPTFVFASFPDPHHPFCPPRTHASLIDPDDVVLPATFWQDPSSLPPHLSAKLEARGEVDPDETLLFAASEQQFREAAVAEAGLVAMVDDAVGQIMAAVTDNGLDGDTVTVFTSDHGDLFGDHGLMLKHFAHYDGVTRVPLVVSGVDSSVSSVDALCSNADIPATLLELAGVAPVRGTQGRSLGPLYAGVTDVHRDAVLIEEDQPFGVPGLPAPVRMRTLVTDEARLTLYHGTDLGELYDFATDPGETINRFDDPVWGDLRRRMERRLLAEVLSLADEGQQVMHGA